MIFLPRGASVIDVSPVNHDDKVAWAFFMASDLRALSINPIKLPLQRAVPMLHRLKAYKEWHQLTPEWRCACWPACPQLAELAITKCCRLRRRRILERGECPRVSDRQLLLRA